MRRVHLFEWEDQPWLPQVFRDFITDHLRYTQNESMRQPVNLAIARHLEALVEASHLHRIVDLCAGAGGPLVAISRVLADELSCPVDVLLTDLYPNVTAFNRIEAESGGRIKARYQPTSALDVPSDLPGIRTMFTALHHFRPEDVRLTLLDAVQKRAPIAVFEPLERTRRLVVLVTIMSFLRGLTHTPRVGRMTLARFVFTYVLPIAPALFAWDGLVSALRSYTPEELRAIAASTGDDAGYTWEVGRFDVPGPYGLMPTIYLKGMPGFH